MTRPLQALPSRVANAIGAGYIRDPVGRPPGGSTAADYPVHAVLEWDDAPSTTVHAEAMEWNATAVHVRASARGGQWLIRLPAAQITRCYCDSNTGQ